jgi:hypothetical protein
MTATKLQIIATLAADQAEVPGQLAGSLAVHPAVGPTAAGAMPPDRRGQRSPLGLGPMETAIMQTAWEADDWLMVREIRDRMNYPTVAYTSVARIAHILCGKGLLQRDLIERAGRPGPPD